MLIFLFQSIALKLSNPIKYFIYIMIKLLLSALLFLNMPLIGLEKGDNTHENRMLTDLGYINKIFEESYAPAEWKRELFAWDLQSHFQSVVDEIKRSQGKDIKQFQKSLKKLCSSPRDYHVSLSFISTEHASLPFDVRYRNGKYILTHVDKDAPETLGIGDEILSMNGLPIETILTELQNEMGEANRAPTDRGLALQILTKRNGRLCHEIPQGSVNLELKKPYSDILTTCEIPWNYKPERVLAPFLESLLQTIPKWPNNSLLRKRLTRESTLPFYKEMQEVFPDDDLPKDMLGSRKSLFSAVGKEKNDELEILTSAEEQISWLWDWLWGKKLSKDAKKFFDAKLVELPSGKIAGYLRISTFSEEDPEEAFKAFLSAIEYFQSEAEMLLIDQTNNPGGDTLYMYDLASALTDRPLLALKERKLLKQSDILNALEIIDLCEAIDSLKELGIDIFEDKKMEGISLEQLDDLLKEAHFFLDQWKQGHLLTDPFPFFGIDYIKPHPKVNFTKPIFILVNELDFSCGDEFPAIFQDNKRATLIGTPTAGAGGSVNHLFFSNLNGINRMTYTTSIDYRADGTPIENQGITPDIYFDFNNELYENDNVTPNFRKIYEIIDN